MSVIPTEAGAPFGVPAKWRDRVAAARGRCATLLAAAILAASAPGTAAEIDAIREKAKTCAACHGEAGISQIENTPSLAGQPDQFTQWQLVYFRAGTRKHAEMIKIAADLTDADIRNLGAYFAALPPPAAPTAPDPAPALTERGAKVAALKNCASCHRDNYAGQQAIGRLLGQRQDYLLKSLRDYKSGARTGGGVAAMPSAVYGLSDDDLKALAHYLARLR